MRSQQERFFVPQRLARAVNAALARAGFTVQRVQPRADPLRFLCEQRFAGILDIGANRGQFARRARRLFPGAVIHAFEPVPVVFAELLREAAHDHLLKCHNLALGERAGEVAMEVNDFTPSSSLLPISAVSTGAFPYTARRTRQPVQLTTLDAWAAQHFGPELALPQPLLIKMDVQGYEDRVLSGGPQTFERTAAVLCEVSFAPMYEGQLLFDDLHQRLRAAGFRCVGFVEAALDPRSDRPLYADAIFLR